ncbi:MAG TPA: CvpA family protein [Candidatus Avamphibacillus sp.]|nr:CvpA family protein [Candidatus Avamphibacillus sp.]
MIDLILLVLLLFGFLMGLKRGFILQSFHLIGFIVAFVVAAVYYDTIAAKLSLWIPYPELSSDNEWAAFLQSAPLEKAFYNAIAFAIIFFSIKIILQIIASMLDFVASLPILNSINQIAGAILGFLEIYLIIFVVLFILALTPIGNIQEWINDSFIALFIIDHTPYLSEKVKTLWFMELGSIINF